jgi:hypothetical protein
MENDEKNLTRQSDPAESLDDADQTPIADSAAFTAGDQVDLRCRHAVERFVQLAIRASVGETIWPVNCGIKMRSGRNRLAVYTVLFAKGLEGRTVANNCPVGPSGNWQVCPYYEP